MRTSHVRAALAGALMSAAPVHAVSLEELAKKIEALETQNAALKAKVEKLEAAQSQQASQVQQQAQVVANVLQAQAANPGSGAPATVVSSYGEIGYTRPTKTPDSASVDVARAVIGIAHRFDDKTRVVGEFEWEHAIASAGDRGEAEVEQLYVEREFGPGLKGRAGLFLMPVGLLNENHEPTAYYGVFRDDVDTKIIPSTWREVGLGLSGATEFGLGWDLGLVTGPNLGKWDPASTEGRDRGPLQSIHGEGQFAAARNLSIFGAANWRGVPGLLLGGSVFAGRIGNGQLPTGPDTNATLALVDLHARYQAQGWDLAAQYVRGSISHTEALNASFAASGIENPTLVPAAFHGAYVQAAYKLWQAEDYTLAPFVRYERYNTASSFGSLAVAAGNVIQPDEQVWTLGANLRIGEGVVLKADYRGYKLNKQAAEFNLGNSFNLGVGYSF